MTIEQCYEQLHGDYAQVIQRLPSPALVERFIGKFLDDASISENSLPHISHSNSA